MAVVVRPWLWFVAVRTLFRMSAPGWYRHRPFWPRPDPAVLRFRFETAYGTAPEPARAPRVVDFVAYLEWCRDR